jgi:hypothetical protein
MERIRLNLPTAKAAKFILGLSIFQASLIFVGGLIGVIQGVAEKLQATSGQGSEAWGYAFAGLFALAFFGWWLWLNLHAYGTINKLREKAQELARNQSR